MRLSAISPAACQLTAAIFAFWLFEALGTFKSVMVVWSIGFSHYLIGLAYSRTQIKKVFTTKSAWLPLTVIFVGGLALYFNQFSLFLLFGLHHALNEAYLGMRYSQGNWNTATRKEMQLFGCVAHLSGYLLIIYSDWFKNHPTLVSATVIIMVIALARYGWLTVTRSEGQPGSATINVLIAECILLIAVVVDLTVYPVHVYQIVLYHFVFWILFPATKQIQAGQYRSLMIYIVATAITIIGFLAWSPLFVNGGAIARAIVYEYWFVVLSFIHIMLSVAISNANPAWIVSMFAGQSGFPIFRKELT